MPFGKDRTGRIVHVSEVERGLACECVCAECEARLIAKKGEVNQMHFAHFRSQPCEHAGESALHKFAKDILSKRGEIRLPEVGADFGNEKLIKHRSQFFSFDRIILEKRENSIIPDVIAIKGNRKLLIEFAVTHFCDDAKINKIKGLGISALEVDLSGFRHESSREDWESAIVELAPREWLHNPRVGEARRELTERIETRRKREAARVSKQVHLWSERFKSATKPRPFAVSESQAIPLQNICDAGFESLVGLHYSGNVCFETQAKYWQSFLFEYFLIQPAAKFENYGFQTKHCLNFLKKHGFVRREFCAFIDRDTEKAVLEKNPKFQTPFGTVFAYLECLRNAGFLWKHGREWSISPSFRTAIREAEQISREHPKRLAEVKDKVFKLLNALPDNDWETFRFEEWFEQYQPSIGVTAQEAVSEGRDKFRSLKAALGRLERMAFDPIFVPRECLCLPLDMEAERRTETLLFKKAEAERKASEGRAEKLTGYARLLLGAEFEGWLHKPHDGVGSTSPHALAIESESGLARALNLVHRRSNEIAAEQDRARRKFNCKERLADSARTLLGADRAEIFLHSAHPGIGRKRPAEYCIDELSLRTCLELLPTSKRGVRVRGN